MDLRKWEIARDSKTDEIPSILNGSKFVTARKKSGNIRYLNVPICFDIEVSSFYQGLSKRAVMYAWVLCIDGFTIFGRDWPSALNAFQTLSDSVKAMNEKNCECRAIVYVHNLSYEFQWLRNLVNIKSVFALSERDPIKAELNDLNLEFRCSYHLSNYGLGMVGKNLLRYKVEKKIGDLDYSLVRFPSTPLTEKEWGYIRNDGKVVVAYIQELIDELGSIVKIPLTQTGFVRRYCMEKCLYGGKSHRNNISQYVEYSKLMRGFPVLDVAEYVQLRERCFQGGFTHASHLWSGITAHDVTSFDFTSSYPSVMVLEKFPMSKGKRIEVTDKEQFKRLLRTKCCMFDAVFKNIRSKIGYENYISSSKCWTLKNATMDNGRVDNASVLGTTLTELDFRIIKAVYEWDNLSIKNMIVYDKGYLPFNFVMSVLDLYEDKTALKGVDGKEREYQNAKERLNSCYGMCVTDICKDTITYEDGEWGKDLCDMEDALHRYNSNKRRFLCYQWGVWITAYARYNLWRAIIALGKSDIDGKTVHDYIYSDTDSVKFVHYERHKKFFQDYNDGIVWKIRHVSMARGIPLKKFMPKTIKGKVKIIGQFDFDGHYQTFRTLGAKRYMTRSVEHGLSFTIAGVSKKYGVKYLLQRFGNAERVFANFDDGLVFPAKYALLGEERSATGKNLHTYIDEPYDGVFDDYRGVPYEYHELSGVHLEACEYSLSMTTAYLEYIRGRYHRDVN